MAGGMSAAAVGPKVKAAIEQDFNGHAPPSWYKRRNLVLLNLLLIIPLLGSATTGFDGSLMNGLQSLTKWKEDFNSPIGTMRGFINAAMSIGTLMGNFPAAWSADKFGRKPTLGVGAFAIVIATIIQATATHSRVQLIVSRFIVGIGGSFVIMCAPILLAEVAYPSHRGVITALYMCFYFVGSTISSWTCFGTSTYGSSWAWRVPTILQALLPLIQLCFIYWLPESPRWLASKGRQEEARAILTKFHADGNPDSVLVSVEMDEIVEAIDMESVSKSGTSFWSLFKGRANRRRTAIVVYVALITQWGGNQVVAYYISVILNTIGITSQRMQTKINGCLQIYNLVFAVCGALVVDKLGRRPLWLIATGGMLVSYVIWTAFSARFQTTGSVSDGNVVLAFIFIYYFFHAIAYAPLAASYPAEIFTYTLRAKGMSLNWFVSNSSVLIGAFCNSIALDAIAWKYYILFCVILAATFVIIFLFFPETRGRSLEEISDIFDSPSVFVIGARSKAVQTKSYPDTAESIDVELGHAKPEVSFVEDASGDKR